MIGRYVLLSRLLARFPGRHIALCFHAMGTDGVKELSIDPPAADESEFASQLVVSCQSSDSVYWRVSVGGFGVVGGAEEWRARDLLPDFHEQDASV